jgi:hypothetical protein
MPWRQRVVSQLESLPNQRLECQLFSGTGPLYAPTQTFAVLSSAQLLLIQSGIFSATHPLDGATIPHHRYGDLVLERHSEISYFSSAAMTPNPSLKRTCLLQAASFQR